MRVLIVKLGALGDVVMATALIRAIQTAHTGAELWLLTTPVFVPLFHAWSGLQTIAFPRRGCAASFARLRWVRRQRFDRIYDLQGNDRTALLCALSGIPERVGNPTRYPYTHHPGDKWIGQCHIFERMNVVLASAGLAPAPPAPVLPAGPLEQARVADWLRRHALAGQTYAIMHAGASASRQDKCWPYFGDLGVRLERQGIRVVWVGAGADSRQNWLLARRCGIDATGAFSILELAELARHARFAVTNDSGPMHICAAAAIPVFGLFGPSDWRRNHALGQAEHVIACVDFAAGYRGALLGDCLARLPVDAVWARLAAAGLVI